MGPDGELYANTVGTCGVVSACQNWGRLASAAHIWALKLVGEKKVYLVLFLTTQFSQRKKEIFHEVSLLIIFSFNNRMSFKREKILGAWRFGLVRVLSKHSGEKCGIFEVKRRFALAKYNY